LVCRTEHPLSIEIRRKLALFCNVDLNSVIESIDAETIYDVPMLMLNENLDSTVLTKLRIADRQEPKLVQWKQFLKKLKNPKHEVRIGLVGKYIELADAYKSIHEAFVHGGAVNDCRVHIENVHSESLEGSKEEIGKRLGHLDGILVAPGFGERGIEGKIRAIEYVRENNIPFFGICLGMQCCVVEFTRNVLHLKGASSTEVNENAAHPVIDLMPDQKNITLKGGTMRLGAYSCEIIGKNTKAYEAYQSLEISERHRHRYEFNNKYLEAIKEAGLIPTGINPDSKLVEIVELKNHPWFVGVQFHPELKSTVEAPHPLFAAFIKASMAYQKKNSEQLAVSN